MAKGFAVQTPAFHIGRVDRKPSGCLAVGSVLHHLPELRPVISLDVIPLQMMPWQGLMQGEADHLILWLTVKLPGVHKKLGRSGAIGGACNVEGSRIVGKRGACDLQGTLWLGLEDLCQLGVNSVPYDGVESTKELFCRPIEVCFVISQLFDELFQGKAQSKLPYDHPHLNLNPLDFLQTSLVDFLSSE